ncbi:MAG: sugar-binding domain-containing protein [Bacteroidota bacterium]
MKMMASVLLLLTGLNPTIHAQPENSETLVQYLSGTGKDHTVAWDFYCSAGRQSGEWTKIPVPSCWELQGFGNYNYGRDYKSDKAYHDEHGLYRHRFQVPSDWKDKEVKIVFEGVMTDCEVKINGKLAGEIHQGAFYEFKYTITQLLTFGEENLLEVKVNKTSANESINHAERRADYWIFGGIYRPVYLEVLPKTHISRVAIDARASGELTAELHLSSKKAASAQLVLQDLNGNNVQDLRLENLQKENDTWTLTTKASDIKTWNPEKPHLYQLQVRLLDNS